MKNMKTTTIQLPKPDLEKLRAQAHANGRSLSSELRIILADYIANREGKP